VLEKTGGRLRIEILPDGQLGGTMGLLTQLRNGTIEMAPFTGQVLGTAQALTHLPMIGFAWGGYDRVWRAMDGEIGRLLRDLLAQRANLIALDTVWDFGFRVVTTTEKPVRNAADLRGLRLRTPVEPEFVQLFQALGAQPVAMALPDSLRALVQKRLDGQESLLALVRAADMHLVQSHCALTNHIWDGQFICVNPGAWRRLTDANRAIVATAFNTAGLRQRTDHETEAVANQLALEQEGMKFYTVDQASFRSALGQAGYYRDLKKKFGDRVWDILERYTGRLV
jgi:TRAP-type C4-dicarboxylate transport system substrate-binding protein